MGEDMHPEKSQGQRALGSVLTALGVLMAIVTPAAGLERDWSAVLGSSHVAGKYYFTQRDYLNEGAVAVAGAGMRVIKVWLDKPAHDYPWNSTFPPRFESLTEMVQHPHFEELFRRPFDVYVLTAFHKINFKEGCPDPLPEQIEQEYCALAKHLLLTYRGTGKTFIIGHHEADWHLRGCTDTNPKHDPGPTAIQGMIRWYRARQAGVDRARSEVRDSDVKLYHAAEVNLVKLAMAGRPTVTNDVLPHLRCDMVSYSAYDVVIGAREAGREEEVRRELRRALEYLDSKVADRAPFGSKNIFISEYGTPEREWGEDQQAAAQVLRVCRTTVEVASEWGCPWIIYWEIYDNECALSGDDRRTHPGGVDKGARPATKKDQCRGFWLVKVDGTFSTARDYLTGLLKPCLVPVTDFGAELPAGARSVRLWWNGGSPEVTYRIERSVAGGPYALLTEALASAKQFVDQHLEGARTCQYRIRSQRPGYPATAWFYSRPGPPKPEYQPGSSKAGS